MSEELKEIALRELGLLYVRFGWRSTADAIKKIRAIPTTRPSPEWQPISSAPKDGTWFMICNDRDGFDSYEVGRHEPYMWADYVEVEGGLFRKENKEILSWRGFNNFHRATHWKPLDKPPQVASCEQ